MEVAELEPFDGTATAQQVFAYQQRVGSINFAAVTTRPDVSRASSKLAEFLTNPSPSHLKAADRVISYLNGTRNLAIEYCGTNGGDAHVFVCFSDAAFADNLLSRKSSDGYLFGLFGGPIDWRASKQKAVTLSSTEAELYALSQAARETIWWRRFFAAIKFNTQQPFTINCDNL